MKNSFDPASPAFLEQKKMFEEEGLNPVPSNQKPDWMPIHWFAVSRSPDFLSAQAWVAAGGNVDEPSESGDTALHLAVWNRQHDQVEWLVGLGASANVKNKKGNTPFHQAFRRMDWVSADLLMERADWSVVDNAGMAALSHAIEGFASIKAPPPESSPSGKVWKSLLDVPKSTWERAFSAQFPIPVFERVPEWWQARLVERWMMQALPSAPHSRAPAPRF